MINLYKFLKSYFCMRGLSHKEKMACLNFGLHPESTKSSPDYLFINLEDGLRLFGSSVLCLATARNKPMGSDEVREFCQKSGLFFDKKEPLEYVYRCFTNRDEAIYVRIATPSLDLISEWAETRRFPPLVPRPPEGWNQEREDFYQAGNKAEIQSDCRTCEHHHGQIYGGVELVCGIHPYGYSGDGCSDYQARA